MSAHVRVLLVNKKDPLFKTEPLPTSVYDLANPRYKGKVASAIRSLAPPLCTAWLFSNIWARPRRSSFLKTCSRTKCMSCNPTAMWKTALKTATSRLA